MRFNSSCDQINNDTHEIKTKNELKLMAIKNMPILTNRISVLEWNV